MLSFHVGGQKENYLVSWPHDLKEFKPKFHHESENLWIDQKRAFGRKQLSRRKLWILIILLADWPAYIDWNRFILFYE